MQQRLHVPVAAMLAMIVVAGFAIGGLLGVLSRSRDSGAPSVATAPVVAAPAASTGRPVRVAATAPTVTATIRASATRSGSPTAAAPTTPRLAAAPTAIAAPTPATMAPAATSASPVTAAAATSAPGITTAAAGATAAQRAPHAAPIASTRTVPGTWEIDEANVQVGTIVWRGDAVPTGRNAVAIAVHKASIGGRRASPCEQQSTLRATVALDVTAQTVPYEELNCRGTSMPGEVRITRIASDGGSFSGTFWSGGALLGSFAAHGGR